MLSANAGRLIGDWLGIGWEPRGNEMAWKLLGMFGGMENVRGH